MYVTPYLGPDQIVSGTLSYALGCGKAIVSTKYLYAKSVLGPGRGLLADFADAESLADAILRILSDPQLRHNLEEEAFRYGRRTTWHNVAIDYLDIFRVGRLRERSERYQPTAAGGGPTAMTEEAVIQEAGYPGEISNLYPPLDLRHLKHLTDASGIIQHAYFTIPNRRTGYCVDDNSRALLVALQCYAKSRDPDLLRLASTYLSFMRYAHLPDGRFHNFVAYDQSFLDAVGSEDLPGQGCLGAWLRGNG